MTELSVVMSNTCMRIKSHHLAAAVMLAGLTACGGGTSNSVPDLIPAAAQDAAVSIPAENIAVDTIADNTDSITEAVAASDNIEQAVPLVIPGSDADLSGNVGALVAAAGDVTCEADAAVFSQTMLAVTNASRVVARSCGAVASAAVPALSWNDNLAQAADVHARDMAGNNFFDHTGSDGLGVPARADAAGYVWRAVGENIAAGQLDAAEVQQGWLDSPGHCENIMNGVFTEVGAACVSDENTDFGTYWVVVFGTTK